MLWVEFTRARVDIGNLPNLTGVTILSMTYGSHP